MVAVLHITETEKTDEQLAAEAAREDSDGPAFTALVQRHQPRVWRICYRLMGNEHDAGDAAQEVFVALFLSRGRFEGKAKFSTWLYAIAIRTCLRLRRARGRRKRHEAAATATYLEQQSYTSDETTSEVTLDLNQMLETLHEEDRALLMLKYAEEYNHEELAELFDLSVSACKMRISRARDELQQRFPNEQV